MHHNTLMKHASAGQLATSCVAAGVNPECQSFYQTQRDLFQIHCIISASLATVSVPFKPLPPPLVRRHAANCVDEGLTEWITIY